MPQTRDDRERILKNLPEGVTRVQVIDSQGQQTYKRPEDVDVLHDEIVLNSGNPVVMRGQPGRRPKIVLPPSSPEVAEISEAREGHVASDLISKEVRKDAEGTPIMDLVLAGMASEAAALEFERTELERRGKDTTAVSIKRARVLKAIADTWMRRKTISEGGLIDLSSPSFRALFAFIVNTFKEAMISAGTRPEMIETTLTHLVKALQDNSWKEEAKAKMRGKSS